MIVNYAIFGAFLVIASVLGFFLWQTLFASKENSQAYEEAKITHSQQQTGQEHPFGGGPVPRNANPTEEAIAEYTKWVAIFTLFLVLATIALFISGERNVDVARRSANAAQKAADATGKQVEAMKRQLSLLEADQRPWIQIVEIKPLPDQPRIEGNKVLLSLDVLIKNVGRSPAFVLVVHTELISKEKESRQGTICATAESKINSSKESSAWTVVPNDSLWYLAPNLLLDVGMDEITNPNVEYRPHILGCVVYRSAEDGVLHRTPFIANISFEEANSSLLRFQQGPIKIIDGRVPTERLRIKNLASPGIAD